MAGDMIDRGRIVFLDPVLSRIERVLGYVPVVAVFGNEEYHDVKPLLKSRYGRVVWLDDELRFLECGGSVIAVVGTTGSLQRPTRWQARNIPGIAETYRRRPSLVAGLIGEARSRTGRVILVSHYALSRATIEGEPRSNWPWLYSPDMEKAVARARPSVAIHGHAHKGKPFSFIDGVPVYNVAFPLNRRIVTVVV
jgi:Icc-related predicted phosphoesterase